MHVELDKFNELVKNRKVYDSLRFSLFISISLFLVQAAG